IYGVTAWAAMTLLTLHAEEPRELKIIARHQRSSIEPVQLKSGDAVIRNAEELVALSSKPDAAKDAAVQKEMEAALAKLLNVKAIDWTKHMVLVLARDRQETGDVGITIDSLKVEGRVLTVAWKQKAAARTVGYPKALLLVERFD